MEKYLTTREFGKSIGSTPESIRVRLCKYGTYFGIKPEKLPNRRLLWPTDALEILLSKKNKECRQ